MSKLIRILFFTIACILLLFSCKEHSPLKLKTGIWQGKLHLDTLVDLPFNFKIFKKDSIVFMEIYNAYEIIEVNELSYINDSLFIKMPYFDSEFLLKNNGDTLIGKYIDHSRESNYQLPFTAAYNVSNRFDNNQKKIVKYPRIKNYHVVFSPNNKNQYNAILNTRYITPSRIAGNFQTETGDYRFLEGNIENGILNFSAFDGSHAFLFKIKIINKDSLYGTFWSGNHWKENLTAKRNDTFKLENPYQLTNKTNHKVDFKFPNLDNKLISINDKKYKDKPLLIQIMGSWCPNCLDESKYLKTVYDKYNKDGLEIIALAFEKQKDTNRLKNNLKNYKNSIKINYDILIASNNSNKNEAKKILPFLDTIISYPTTIYLNRKHEIIKIHTGFNGPASKEKFLKFKNENDYFINKILN